GIVRIDGDGTARAQNVLRAERPCLATIVGAVDTACVASRPLCFGVHALATGVRCNRDLEVARSRRQAVAAQLRPRRAFIRRLVDAGAERLELGTLGRRHAETAA